MLTDRFCSTWKRNVLLKVISKISSKQLKSFFEEHDLDFETNTIIRREVTVNGKSRAFVNDTPTTLVVLKSLSEQLIDLHSQHENLDIVNDDFQFTGD